MKDKLVNFENTFFQNEEDLKQDSPDMVGRITIDGYPADENASGGVVATVTITKRGDIVVQWILNEYRMNEDAANLVKESIETLRKEFAG